MTYTKNSHEVKNLIDSVSCACNLDQDTWMSMSRLRDLVIIRQMFYYICRNKIRLTLKNCGNLLGQDHSTVLHAVDAVQFWLDNPKIYIEENNLYNHIMMEYGKRNKETIYVDSDGGIWTRHDSNGSITTIER